MMHDRADSLWFWHAITWLMLFGASALSQTITSSSPIPTAPNIPNNLARGLYRPTLLADDALPEPESTVKTIANENFGVSTNSLTPIPTMAAAGTPIHMAESKGSRFKAGDQVCSNAAPYWPLKKATLSYDEARIEEAIVKIVNPITSAEVLSAPSDSWYKPESQSPELVYIQINMIHRSTQESGWIRAYVNAAHIFPCRYKS